METQCGWKPPAAICLYLLSIRNSFYNDFVLVQSFTSTQAATCRELQLSLLEGSYNPLLLFFQGPLFINFQTGSMNINQSSSISASNNLLFPISTESSKHFSDSCTQNTVTITTNQILNPEYCSNRQRQLDHNLKIYATSTTWNLRADL